MNQMNQMNHSSDNFSWYDDRLLCLNTANKGGTFDLDSIVDESLLATQIVKGDGIIFPNPTDGIINIDFCSGNEIHVEIFALDGSRILVKNLQPSNQNFIDLSYLAKGLYTYKISSASCASVLGKLLKQ